MAARRSVWGQSLGRLGQRVDPPPGKAPTRARLALPEPTPPVTTRVSGGLQRSVGWGGLQREHPQRHVVRGGDPGWRNGVGGPATTQWGPRAQRGVGFASFPSKYLTVRLRPSPGRASALGPRPGRKGQTPHRSPASAVAVSTARGELAKPASSRTSAVFFTLPVSPDSI